MMNLKVWLLSKNQYSIETLIFRIPEEAEARKLFETSILKSVLTSEKSRKIPNLYRSMSHLFFLIAFQNLQDKKEKILQTPLQNASCKCTE